MATATLTVRKVNRRALKATRKQRFTCEKMDNVVNIPSGNGASFMYRTERPIPSLYEVTQTVNQINALCNQCCTSGGSGNP